MIARTYCGCLILYERRTRENHPRVYVTRRNFTCP
nr:MAG TPA: hypothetical protein [Caudoviricetes sp.]